MQGFFDIAAIAIFIAMVADTLDGRVARLTNTESAFGAQYDSLSDMVAFGIAPALVAYSWVLDGLGKVGWIIAFFYTAATALRLARFNIISDEEDKRFFIGLPCPSAAATVAAMVWIGHEYGLSRHGIAFAVGAVAVLVALLMVSNIRYYSFKEVDFKRSVPFVWVLFVVLIFVWIAMDPPQVLFAVFFLYSISGPVMAVWKCRKICFKKEKK